MNAIVKPLEELYSKAPALPTNWKESLVKVSPWLALVFGVLSLLTGLLGVLGAGAVSLYAPLAGAAGGILAVWIWVSVVLLFVEGVVLLLAYPSLKKRLLKGWNLLFLLELVWLVSRVIDVLTLNVSGIVGAVIGAVVGFYFLFQIKSYYK